MNTIPAQAAAGNAGLHDVLRPFLQQPGLPFADAIGPETIEQVFRQRDGLFAPDAIFSTPVVLWAFLAQVLRDGKGAACAAAVADVATYMQQTDRPAPSGDTGDYCRARAKLDLAALRDLVGQTARQLEEHAHPDWLWHGRHAGQSAGVSATEDPGDGHRPAHRAGLRGVVSGDRRHSRRGHRPLRRQGNRRAGAAAADSG